MRILRYSRIQNFTLQKCGCLDNSNLPPPKLMIPKRKTYSVVQQPTHFTQTVRYLLVADTFAYTDGTRNGSSTRDVRRYREERSNGCITGTGYRKVDQQGNDIRVIGTAWALISTQKCLLRNWQSWEKFRLCVWSRPESNEGDLYSEKMENWMSVCLLVCPFRCMSAWA